MNNELLVGTRKGLFVCERNNGKWAIKHTAFLGVQVPYVLIDPRDGLIYAALDHGHFGVKLHRSKDGGASWTEITAPSFPEKPEEEPEIKCPMRGTPIPWNVELIWTLAAGGADQPGLLWAGTIPGALFQSTDSGESWELVRGLWDRPERAKWMGGGFDYPGIHSICVDPNDSSHVLVGVSCGGTWVTHDGGSTWENCAKGMRAEYAPPENQFDPDIQDPHYVAQCAGQPDHLWTQHHNGIFRSTNDSVSWEEVKNVKPSAFGFAVAVHPKDGNTAWFVPAVKDEERVPADGKVVVTRTRDGGKTFDVLSKGLPQEHAYDLTFRHALDVAKDGESLAFGSTTGSVWTSADGGDSWGTLNEHLPPVYCVKFC